MNDVDFTASAAREFRALSAEMRQRVGRAVDGLTLGSRPPGVRKLVGHQSLDRIRVGHHRVIYDGDDGARSILITRIRHGGRSTGSAAQDRPLVVITTSWGCPADGGLSGGRDA